MLADQLAMKLLSSVKANAGTYTAKMLNIVVESLPPGEALKPMLKGSVGILGDELTLPQYMFECWLSPVQSDDKINCWPVYIEKEMLENLPASEEWRKLENFLDGQGPLRPFVVFKNMPEMVRGREVYICDFRIGFDEGYEFTFMG